MGLAGDDGPDNHEENKWISGREEHLSSPSLRAHSVPSATAIGYDSCGLAGRHISSQTCTKEAQLQQACTRLTQTSTQLLERTSLDETHVATKVPYHQM